MTKRQAAFVVFLMTYVPIVLAQMDLSGTWQGVLAVDPETKVPVHFVFRKNADDSFSATLVAPDQPSLTGIAVDSLTVEQGNLTMVVNEVGGTYEAQLTDDGNLEGTWIQEGAKYPLTLRPYKQLSADDKAAGHLLGSWHGTLRPPSGDQLFTIVFRFELNDEGDVQGFLDTPHNGVADVPINSIKVDGTQVSLEANQIRMRYAGVLKGPTLEGQWSQRRVTVDLNMKKGTPQISELEMSDELFFRLEGPWHGKLDKYNIILRFEKTEDGKYFGFMDNPDRDARGIPISSTKVQGNQITFSFESLGAELVAMISPRSIAGDWRQNEKTLALSLVQGDYDPYRHLSRQGKRRLEGAWHGEVNNTKLIFRFSNDREDSFSAFVEVPGMESSNIHVSDVTLDEDNNIAFNVNAIDARYEGTLSGNVATGNWTRAELSKSLTLTKK